MRVYLNGRYVPQEEAVISVNDRGFLFGDGLYEVARVYNGRPFMMDAHLRRLADGLRWLQIDFEDVESLAGIAERLIEENELHGDATVYIQVSRGAAPRKHAFPSAAVPPTVYVAASPFNDYPEEYWRDGVDAITAPDTRWARCNFKTVNLLSNVLANQAAHAAGAFEALFVRDGVLIEGSHSNLFGVIDGTLVTYPNCNYILPGITRAIVLELAAELGIPVRIGPILMEELPRVSELFLSGTTTEVMPIARLDGRPVGTGRAGPIAARLQQAYRARTGRD